MELSLSGPRAGACVAGHECLQCTRRTRGSAGARPSPFSPVYYGMQFRAASAEQPSRQITALFARPGTSKRNKDLGSVVHRHGPRDTCTRGHRCIANRETIPFNSLETLRTAGLTFFLLPAAPLPFSRRVLIKLAEEIQWEFCEHRGSVN